MRSAFSAGIYLRALVCVFALVGTAAALAVALSATVMEAVTWALVRPLFTLRPPAVVFCGDSHLANLPPHLVRAHWGWGRSWNLAVGGSDALRTVAQLERALALKPEWVVVSVGANDLGLDDERLLHRLEVLMSAQTAPPGTRLMLLAIPLQADEGRDTRIHRLNAVLAQRARNHGWHHADFNEALFPPGHVRREVLADAVHLAATAQGEWLLHIRAATGGAPHLR